MTDRLIFRLPEACDEAALRDYVKEHHDHREQSISASLGLSTEPYADWLGRILRNAEEGDPDWGRSLLLLCLSGDRIVGLLSVRYDLPPELTARYGDIGYGVRPSERGQGYATEMLRHALAVCRGKGMREAVVGCYRDNAASGAVIRKCGGVLREESDRYTPGRTSLYYSIRLA